MSLHIRPVSFPDACAFVSLHHRHHKPPVGWKFGLCVLDDDGVVRGVAIVGRPVSRNRDDGETLEVTRLCVDGTKNAASKLLGACRRAAFALGYRRIGTYTLPREGGASLRAAGWELIGERGGGKWIRSDGSPRDNSHPLETKLLWEATA